MQQTLDEYENIQYDYKQDIKNEIFEKIFAEDYLRGNYIITQGYSPEYDVKDLDMNVTFEIKRDYKWLNTNNILIEQYYNLEEKKKGWIYHTKADYLVVFVTDEIYYTTNMYKLKADFFNNTKTWTYKDIQQPEGFHTRNWLKNYKKFDINFYKINKKIRVEQDQPTPPHPFAACGTQKRGV